MKLWLVAVVWMPGAAAAQGMVLDGSSPTDATPGPQSCITAAVGTATSYACINAAQKALVAQQQANQQGLTLNQNSDPNKLGLFNQAATKEHLGSNFGISSVPQRPPQAYYGSKLVPPPRR